MIALYIILGILLFLFILLLFPVKIDIEYKDEVKCILKYLFIKKDLTETKDETEEDAVETKEVEKDNKKESPVKKLKALVKRVGPQEFLDIIKELLKLVLKYAYSVVKCIKIKKLDIYFVAKSENASDTALLYGKACAIIYPFIAELTTLTKCKDYGVSILCDYEVGKPIVKAEITFAVCPLLVVSKTLKLAGKVLPQLLRLRKTKIKNNIIKRKV